MNRNANPYLYPFILVSTLFFLWAFLHNLNPILIPHLKKACQLTDLQSAFIDFVIYLGYFLIAIPAGIYMHKRGYKKGILLGLFLFAGGALLFIEAGYIRSYGFFLLALFVFATGATFLETCANPYVTFLGPPERSEQRLNFAQSFNGLGAVSAPIIGGWAILSGIEHSKEELANMSPEALNAYLQSESSAVILPYAVFAGLILLVAILFLFAKIPEPVSGGSAAHSASFSFRVLRRPQVAWAVVAEFFYVAAQVGVGSFFVRYSRYVMDLPEKEAAFRLGYIGMVGFMVGRFTGTFFMRYIRPATLLSVYAVINIVLLSVALTTHGALAVNTVLAVPFFMSIMFPTIFALGIKDLGEETKYASSLLVMSIIGGAMSPIAMGFISDRTGSMQIAYIVPLLCFLPILYFGLRGYKAGRKITAA